MDNEKNIPDPKEKEVQSEESQVKEAQPAYDKKYTYSDYLQWDYEDRYELIDGIPYMMSAPNRRHQKILGNLFVQFWTFLKGKHCEVYLAPFDVRLNPDTFDDTVVQPDIVIICDHSKLDDACCKGVPEMVVEILSPSTSKYDKTIKLNTYMKTGVKEYWIIDPISKSLAVNILKDSNYITHVYSNEKAVPVHVLKDFKINLYEVFDE